MSESNEASWLSEEALLGLDNS